MPRPSQNLDKKLLAAGKAMIEEQGVASMSLRGVAKKAGVNLGMFHYHFKGKDDFVRQVLQATYEEFFTGFSLEVGSASDPLEALRRGMLRLGQFSRDNRRLALAMLSDARAGRPEPLAFARKNIPRHAKVIIGLVRQCQKRGLLVKAPLTVVMPMLVGSTVAPILGVSVAEKVAGHKFFGLPVAVLRHLLLSDKAMQSRLRLALRGLMVHPEPLKEVS